MIDEALIILMYKDLLKVDRKELSPNYRQPKEGKYMIIDVFVCLDVNRDMVFSLVSLTKIS